MRLPPGPTAVSGGTAELLADADRDGSWVLLVDDTPQSHVDLDDPTHLEFEYVRRMGHAIDLAAPEGQPLDVLHLGGGALTLPRYVAVTRPGSRQRVVEFDEPLTDLVRTHLPLPRGARVRVRAEDARVALETRPDASADVVVCDVFAGARTPAHLTTAEFVAEVRRGVRPPGTHPAHVADGPPPRFPGVFPARWPGPLPGPRVRNPGRGRPRGRAAGGGAVPPLRRGSDARTAHG